MVDFLLSQGAAINAIVPGLDARVTVLHRVVSMDLGGGNVPGKRERVVRFLVDRGADLTIRDEHIAAHARLVSTPDITHRANCSSLGANVAPEHSRRRSRSASSSDSSGMSSPRARPVGSTSFCQCTTFEPSRDGLPMILIASPGFTSSPVHPVRSITVREPPSAIHSLVAPSAPVTVRNIRACGLPSSKRVTVPSTVICWSRR